jgi:hypothetical protein
MQRTRSAGKKPTQFAALALLAAVTIGAAGLRAAEPSEPPFEGQKSTWHGFDRYDFVMDCTDLTLKPFKAPPGEGAGVGSPPSGQRRCVVVAPKQAATGLPWSWRGCYTKRG